MYKLIDIATHEAVEPGNIVFTHQREAVTLVRYEPPRGGRNGRIVCRAESGSERELFPIACGLIFVRSPS